VKIVSRLPPPNSHLFPTFAHQHHSVKKVSVSVINDLVTDQRVHKVCTTLHTMGFEVTLIGRKQRASMPLTARAYRTKRMKLVFEKGVLFYAFFQLRLFFVLLFTKSHVLVANDLDTLLPNYLVSKLKRIPLVYDTHEIFTEVPELAGSAFKQNTWRRLERWLFPKLQDVFTVNQSISDWYYDKYKVRPRVVRNMPRRAEPTAAHQPDRRIRVKGSDGEREIPAGKKVVVLQGAGINVDRGAEELVQAMEYLDDVLLLIIGSGDVMEQLEQIRRGKKLEEKVWFTGKIPLELLQRYTRLSDLGVTLDKDTNINYRFSLPNKIFDYIQAGIPVLCSDLPEVARIVRDYNVGAVISSHDPKHIAEAIRTAFSREEYSVWKHNTHRAAQELCWETDEKELKAVYSRFL
jgi:glycosyltransferase involved in cell wall biosynthesis